MAASYQSAVETLVLNSSLSTIAIFLRANQQFFFVDWPFHRRRFGAAYRRRISSSSLLKQQNNNRTNVTRLVLKVNTHRSHNRRFYRFFSFIIHCFALSLLCSRTAVNYYRMLYVPNLRTTHYYLLTIPGQLLGLVRVSQSSVVDR